MQPNFGLYETDIVHSGLRGDDGLHERHPYYKEASVVVECETMTAWHQTAEDFRNGTPKEWYDGFEAGIHTVYIGEVLGAWKRN